MEIAFTVEGIPRPQGSKSHIGRGIMVESSKYVATWRSMIRDAAKKAMGCNAAVKGIPIGLRAEFYFERPKSHYNAKGLRTDAPEYVTKKPDSDKLVRAVLDACTAVVYYDDSQVQFDQVHKLWTCEVPRAVLRFRFINERCEA